MIAKVAFPIAIIGLYDYIIPKDLEGSVSAGVPVLVTLRSRELWGVVVKVVPKSKYPNLKSIISCKSESWKKSSSSIIKLYEWMSHYYNCDFGKIFRPTLRKGNSNTTAKFIQVYKYSGVIPNDLTVKQLECAEKLKSLHHDLTRRELINETGISEHMLSIMIKRKILISKKRQILREAVELGQERKSYNITLTEEQRFAVDSIWSTFDKESKPFLLYGITGSGKTHVYIELAKRTLKKNRGVIILVPEISLTPQTIQRFKDALGDVISVIHSRMSNGERRDSVEEIISGRKKVVIGVRSAILIPMSDTALIIVDEEHDSSYKQENPEPRYHARDVSVMRGKFQKAMVVLGSATPSFESYYNAIQKKYTLIKLIKRHGSAKLPSVHIVDMNEEHKQNNWTFLSSYLHDRITETLNDKKQIILLLNRRGFSVSLLCPDCGHVYMCPNCSVNLVYHRNQKLLKCHQCGHEELAPTNCTKCNGTHIKYKGTGIQKAEELLREKFPDAKIIRMDQDTTRLKGAHMSILSAFSNYEADILLGTQMVAKGLNFPGVRLVGVLQADIGLHFPDFRASERTFQLLSQVAGRAGRTDELGEVVIQTYLPDEPAIIATKTHDYESFYNQEFETRKLLKYPPVARLIRIIIQANSEHDTRATAEEIAGIAVKLGGQNINILGPSPAILEKINTFFRYNIVIKSKSVKTLHNIADTINLRYKITEKNKRVIVDIDPQGMM